jgi:hypothetical protein
MLKLIPRYRREFELERVPLFGNANVARLTEHFFNWLTNKKYLSCKLRVNEQYNFAAV